MNYGGTNYIILLRVIFNSYCNFHQSVIIQLHTRTHIILVHFIRSGWEREFNFLLCHYPEVCTIQFRGCPLLFRWIAFITRTKIEKENVPRTKSSKEETRSQQKWNPLIPRKSHISVFPLEKEIIRRNI